MVRLLAWTLGCLWGHEMPPDPLVGSLALVALWPLMRRAATPWRSGVTAAILGAIWGGWWSPPAAPVASPEGTVEVHGEVRRATWGRWGRCSLVLNRPHLDGVPVPGSLMLKVPGDVCRVVAPGWGVGVNAKVRGEMRATNPGMLPPWAEPGWSWSGRTRESPALVPRRPMAGPWLSARAQLPGEEVTGLYRALLLGDRSGISPWVRDAFGDTGTAHLLAISGLHLAVVGWGVYRGLLFLLLWIAPLARRVRVPALAAGLSVIAIWIYVGTVAPSQATLRAAVVLTSVMLGGCLGRWTTPGHTLMVAAAAVLSMNPGAVRGPSFQLSFAAATSLVLLAPWLRRGREWLTDDERLEGPRMKRVGVWVLQAGAVSLVTAAVTAPLCLAWFGQFAPIGVLVNLVAVPLVATLVVPAGVIWLASRALSPALGDLLSPVPTWTGGLLLDLVEGWAEVVGPSTTPMWSHGIALGAVAALLALLWGARGLRWAGAAVLLMGIALVMDLPRGQELSLEVLDVGHGDAILARLPGGSTMLVDSGGGRGGGGGSRWIARRRLLPALQRRGVSQVDLLVITHGDRDHVGAAAHLARRLPIRSLWLPSCDRDLPEVRALASAVRATGGEVAYPQISDPLPWSGVTLQVLWPDLGTADPCERGRNNNSIVLSVSHGGRKILLTGDIEAATERSLVKRWGSHLRSDVLKVAHHGSRTSSTPAFLDAVQPTLSLISGPMRPGGSHPHLEVLRRLRARGSRIGITGRDGALGVSVDERGELHPSQQR